MKDRWQATPAGDMSGKPLPMPQFVSARLRVPAVRLQRALVDFETAYASAYTIDAGVAGPGGEVVWTPVATVTELGGAQTRALPEGSKHVIDDISGLAELEAPAEWLRLHMTARVRHAPAAGGWRLTRVAAGHQLWGERVAVRGMGGDSKNK